MTRIIAMMPVRNEAWILERTLQTLSGVADVIIVADQGSTDGTREILRACHRVVQIENRSATHSTQVRVQLLEAARHYDGENLLLAVDADEMVSANVLTDGTADRLRDVPPGTAVEVEWVHLWRHPFMRRVDRSPWSDAWRRYAFRDDRRANFTDFENLLDHNSRIPAFSRTLRLDSLKILHYQFVAFDRMLAKQRWYRVREICESDPGRADVVNHFYRTTKDERRMRLEPIPSTWVDGWLTRGIDLERFDAPGPYWQELEVLRIFAERGTRPFAGIDIWDIDWEERRQEALAIGWPHVPAEPILDPRSAEQRLRHLYLRTCFRPPPWRDLTEVWKLPALGMRSAARALGIRRPGGPSTHTEGR